MTEYKIEDNCYLWDFVIDITVTHPTHYYVMVRAESPQTAQQMIADLFKSFDSTEEVTASPNKNLMKKIIESTIFDFWPELESGLDPREMSTKDLIEWSKTQIDTYDDLESWLLHGFCGGGAYDMSLRRTPLYMEK